MPSWQELTGLTPEGEQKMSEDERDAAVRKLLARVKRLAEHEFERGEKAPPGERTAFWDPLAKICRLLGISRTKLSAYSRELTGMRAHEITDRIQAKNLPELLETMIESLIEPQLKLIERNADRKRLGDDRYRWRLIRNCFEFFKGELLGPGRKRWAYRLGFANPSRLAKASLLCHEETIDELQARAVEHVVQKFLDRLREEFEKGGAAKQTGTEAGPTTAQHIKEAMLERFMHVSEERSNSAAFRGAGLE